MGVLLLYLFVRRRAWFVLLMLMLMCPLLWTSSLWRRLIRYRRLCTCLPVVLRQDDGVWSYPVCLVALWLQGICLLNVDCLLNDDCLLNVFAGSVHAGLITC